MTITMMMEWGQRSLSLIQNSYTHAMSTRDIVESDFSEKILDLEDFWIASKGTTVLIS